MKLRNLLLALMVLLASGVVSAQTAVTPAAGTANPFAYALSSEVTDGVITINYSLNADAEGVELIVKNSAGDAVITQTLEGITKGAHTATVSLDGQATDTYSWEIKVTGVAKAAVEEFTALRFYHPRGIDVDNNMESSSFGNVYITEGVSTTNGTYWSGTHGGLGLYAFSANMEPIINPATNNYSFTGGWTLNQKIGAKDGADFARVRVADDGRLFVTRMSNDGNYIMYAPSFEDLITNNKFTSLFDGLTLDASTYKYSDANGNFMAAANVGFDVKGNGENLKMIAISGNINLWSFVYSGGSTDEYALGTATTLPIPTNVPALTGKYTIAPQTTNVEYDNRGGIWYCQGREKPTDVQPGLVYIDSEGNEKYKDLVGRGGGGIRLSPDGKQIAISSNYKANATLASTFSIYDLTWNEDGTPTLTEKYTITHTIGTNCYDIAWDLANNVYICGNSKEYLKGFSIPRANNDFTTKAASKYAVSYEAPVVPVEVPALYTDPVAETFPEATIDDINLGKIEEVAIAELEGKTVRSAELRGENLYVLALDAQKAPYVYVVNTTSKAVTTVSTEGLVAEGAEGGLALSDLTVTADGYLVACNYVHTSYNNAEKPEAKVYVWEKDENGLPAGVPSKWWGFQAPARFSHGWAGETMAFTGSLDNGTALLTAARTALADDTAKSGHLRWMGITTVNGEFVKDTSLGITFTSYNAYNPSTYNESVYGSEYQFAVSPLNEANFIFDGSIAQPIEAVLDGSNSTDCTINATLAEGVADAAVTNAGYFKYAGKSLMVVPANGVINVVDITGGFANAVQALSVEAENASAGMFVAGRGIAGETAEMQLVALNGNTLTLYGQVEPVAPLYITGANVGGNWNPANAAEFDFDGTNYTIVLDETASEFKISTSKGTWDEFNAGNLAVDGAVKNGVAVNLSVNKDGANIVLPWAGEWTITVAGDLSTLTATTSTPNPAFPATVYMVGFNGAWDPANPLEIAGENGVYTVEGVEFTNIEFKISTSKGDWDDFNAGAYDATSNPIAIGEAVALKKGDQNIKISATGTYDVTIDLENLTITLTAKIEYPEVIYAIGDIDGLGWSTNEGVALAHTENGVYEGEFVVDDSNNGFGYFQFATTLGANWDAVNAGTRYGATENNQEVVANVIYNMTNNWGSGTQSWQCEAGSCKVRVDIVNNTMQILEFTGVEGVEFDKNAPVEYYNLQGVKVENPENGTFIKVQGKKSTKVYIK